MQDTPSELTASLLEHLALCLWQALPCSKELPSYRDSSGGMGNRAKKLST